MKLFAIFITALLIDNIVLMRFLALCPFIGMSSDEEKSTGMGVAVIFVTVLATCVTFPIYKFILEPLGLVFLQILVFILIIASLVQLVEFYLKKMIPGLYSSMGIYLALITTNCAILAVTFDVISTGYTFIEALVYALGSASGVMLSMLLLAGIRRRIRTSPVPSFMKGTPVLFIAAALLSMAFMGFKGLWQ
ncbi:MAG: electron transport complex subunit RsxA [Treponema sp.]|jgi:electron transport complex protein RnfA|nr:electron transport complex subunit RsxA [Treponema sp.]